MEMARNTEGQKSSRDACIRSLQRGLQEAIFAFSMPAGRLVALNDTALTFWGFREPLDRASWDKLTLEQVFGAEVAATIQDACARRTSVTVEAELPTIQTPESWEIVVECAPGPSVRYVLVTARLSAAWRGVREHLADCCDNFRMFFDALPGMVCLKAGDGHWIDANQAVRDMLGLKDFSYRGLTNEEVADLLPHYGDVLRSCSQQEELAWEQGSVQKAQERHPLPNGKTIQLEVVRHPLFYPDGRRKLLLVWAQDITEKVEALQSLSYLETRYRWLLERMQDAVYILKDYKLVFVNGAFSRLVGYPVAELLGRDARDLVAPEDRERTFSFYRRRLSGQPAPLEYSLRLLHRDGHRVPVDLSVTLIHYQGDIAVMGTLRDASARLASEELDRRKRLQFREQHQALVRMSTEAALVEGDLETGLAMIARLTADVLGVAQVGIWRILADEHTAVCLVSYADGQPVDCRDSAINLEQYPRYSAALYAGLMLDVENVREDPRTSELTKDYWEPYGVRASIEVPIRIHGEVAGILCCEHTEIRKWSPDESWFAGQVAELIAQAFLSDDLRNKTQALEREKASLEMLYRLSRQLNSSLVFQEVAQQALEELCSFFEGVRGLLLSLDRSGQRMVLAASFGYDQEGKELLQQFIAGLGVGVQGWVAQTRQVMIAEDVRNDPRWAVIPGLDEDIRSAVSLPLLRGDNLLGILTICSPTLGYFHQEHLKLLESAAATIAIALDNARLFESERTEREWAEALEAATSLVNRSLDLDEVLDRILKQVSRVVPGDTFNVMLVEGDHARVVRWRGYEHLHVHPSSAKPIALQQYPNLMRMLRSGEPVVIGDTRRASEWISSVETEWRRSYVAAPIQVEGETVGFLNVNGLRAYQFNAQDAQRLKAFTSHVAMAIQHARHFQQKVRYAEELERVVQQRTLELAAKTEWLEAVLESTTDGIVVVNSDGYIVQSNRVAQRWLSQTLSPLDAERLRQSIRLLSQSVHGHPTSLILELTGLDLELSAAVVQQAELKESATVVVLHDVTHLKALERMKSEFISNVSHELRTPVTSIRLYVTLLRRHSQNCAPRYLEALERDSVRLVDLVADILEISRIDAGRLSLSPRDTDLDRLVLTILEAHHLLFENHQLAIETQLSLGVRQVRLDAEKVSHVLNNVIDNAINYTSPGGKITVKTYEACESERHWAVIEISDTGMGIPEDELPYVFERFFRGQEPQRRQIQGSGLGLAIVKEIVELHGGYVRVQSEAQRGTTFTIGFPMDDNSSLVCVPENEPVRKVSDHQQ